MFFLEHVTWAYIWNILFGGDINFIKIKFVGVAYPNDLPELEQKIYKFVKKR